MTVLKKVEMKDHYSVGMKANWMAYNKVVPLVYWKVAE